MRWIRQYKAKKPKYKRHERRVIDRFLLFPTTVLFDFTEVRWLEKASIIQEYDNNRWGNIAWADDKASALKSVDSYNKNFLCHDNNVDKATDDEIKFMESQLIRDKFYK